MPRAIRPRNPYLSAAMANSGLTATELGRRSGVHRVIISRLLAQRQGCTDKTAAKLARVLGVKNPADLRLAENIPEVGDSIDLTKVGEVNL